MLKYSSFGLWDPSVDPDQVLANIKTKVHPLNKDLVTSARLDSTDDEECGNEYILSDRTHEVRLLSYNLMLIPKSVSSETFVPAPCKLHDERVAALFDLGFLDEFDIVCVQECFDGLPGSLKEQFLMHAAKAGFVYVS